MIPHGSSSNQNSLTLWTVTKTVWWFRTTSVTLSRFGTLLQSEQAQLRAVGQAALRSRVKNDAHDTKATDTRVNKYAQYFKITRVKQDAL